MGWCKPTKPRFRLLQDIAHDDCTAPNAIFRLNSTSTTRSARPPSVFVETETLWTAIGAKTALEEAPRRALAFLRGRAQYCLPENIVLQGQTMCVPSLAATY